MSVSEKFDLLADARVSARLKPARCGLVLVDIQNDYCHEDGATAKLGYDTSLIREVLPNIHRLIDIARRADVPRIYLQVGHDEWTDTPAWIDRYSMPASVVDQGGGVARFGTWGSELYDLNPTPDELVIRKYRYSGFAYTPLELALRSRGVDTVVFAGTQTNVCVEATASDALIRDLLPVVVSDCTASGSRVAHDAALKDMQERLGLVVDIGTLEHAWAPPTGG